jgi:AICAR transformylase/IMP cyclohydrolase PurH
VELRYGINPEQLARAGTIGESAPIRLLSGRPSYINLLDALNAWPLVREAAAALDRPAAASFKHVSPAGAAVAGPIDAVMAETWAAGPGALSPVARAYIRARDCDPKSSFGDFVAVSAPAGDGWTATAPDGSSAGSPAGPRSPRKSGLTPSGTHSSPQRSMRGFRCATCRKRPPTLTRVPPP